MDSEVTQTGSCCESWFFTLYEVTDQQADLPGHSPCEIKELLLNSAKGIIDMLGTGRIF